MSDKEIKMPVNGDSIILKKPHACGGNEWQVTRTGMDFGLRCLQCGRNIMLPRRELQRQLKEIISKDKKEGTLEK